MYCRQRQWCLWIQHKAMVIDNRENCRSSFLLALGRSNLGEELFDEVADTVFFVKDKVGRYVAVNKTLVSRLGFKQKSDVVGLAASEVFRGALGERFSQQDKAIIAGREALNSELELHLYPKGKEGWCLTWKVPILGRDGSVIGLSGISRDLPQGAVPQNELRGVSRALDHLHDNLDVSMRVGDIAAIAGLSIFQFDKRLQILFGISASQYLMRARVDLARRLLGEGKAPISAVALECGYGDQAAFTRQFHVAVGMTPRAYRKRLQGCK